MGSVPRSPQSYIRSCRVLVSYFILYYVVLCYVEVTDDETAFPFPSKSTWVHVCVIARGTADLNKDKVQYVPMNVRDLHVLVSFGLTRLDNTVQILPSFFCSSTTYSAPLLSGSTHTPFYRLNYILIINSHSNARGTTSFKTR